MKTNNKHLYLWVIQGHYGLGWEDVDQSENYQEAKASLRIYTHEEPTNAHRLIRRREPNPLYKEQDERH